jgi:hypothetical protein
MKKTILPPLLVPANRMAGLMPRCRPLIGLFVLGLSIVFGISSPAESTNSMLWGVMDWQTSSNGFPNTDASWQQPIFQDGGCHLIVHQYQGSTWLPFRTSATNMNEVSRIYGSGNCVELMLYFVACAHNTNNNTFGYPLNSQFLSDYAQLLNAYKVGGGPLYINVFPEFEEWYNSLGTNEQAQYRAQIVSQFNQMAQITHTNYSQAYLGLNFEARDFTGDTSQFTNRWNQALTNGDVVFVNPAESWTNWGLQAQQIVQGTQILNHWGLPIIEPYVDIWDDDNTPIFYTGDNYNTDAANYSAAITNWIGSNLVATAEVDGSGTRNWSTNLRQLKSRGLMAYILYSDDWNNKPVTPPDPNGFTHALPSYTVLTNLMNLNNRSYLYPVNEMEFWPGEHPPTASTGYSIVLDTNCSSGSLVVLNATNATNQYFTYPIPVTHNGTYEVYVGIRKEDQGGWFYLYVNGSGSQLGSERNCSLASGVSDYQEYDQGSVAFTNLTGTTWINFKFGVAGVGNDGGYQLGLDYILLVPHSPVLAPQAPTGVAANGWGSGKILLNWNAAAGATGYNVKYSSLSGGPYTTIANNVSSLSYTNTGLTDGTTYYYVVSATNSAGGSPNSLTEASATTKAVIVDDADPSGVIVTGTTNTGTWSISTSTPGYYGVDYLNDGDTGADGGKSVRFSPLLPVTGTYNVYLRWTANANRASNAPVDVNYAGGTETFSVNEQANNGTWVLLGTYSFNAGTAGNVLVRNDGANGYVIADAVEFVLQ